MREFVGFVLFLSAAIIVPACAAGSPVASSTPSVAVPIASADGSSSATCADVLPAPLPSWSGRAADIPEPPAAERTPRKIGDSFTVFGAHRALQNPYDRDELAEEISIVGYIVDSNLKAAPACALHSTRTPNPRGCAPEMPSFTLADSPPALVDAASEPAPARPRVLGWASNFASVWEANRLYKGLTHAPKQLSQDLFSGRDVPFPIPAIGAKVRVTGKYGSAFRGGPMLIVDAVNGVVTYAKMEVLEPAPKPAQLGK